MADDISIVMYRDIQGFPGYRVGDDGSIWSCRTWHAQLSNVWHRMKTAVDHAGYHRVTMSVNGRKKTTVVHRVVLEEFVGSCPSGNECRHLNGNPGDNRAVNLQWGTKSENARDSLRHGTHPSFRHRGENASNASLTETQVKDILQSWPQLSMNVLAAKHGVTKAAVQGVVHGSTWAHAFTNIGRTARKPRSRFSDNDIRTIRELIASGDSILSIARRFAVGKETIRRIRIGEAWRSVQ
ncbi:MAG: hypothetical protein EBR82_36690 [Caulobacteraceae bacterium]|nr:hypothetical protein [Caulobacteraceae bacterium]